MKWIGQNIYDQISKFRNTVDFSEDVTFYQPVNNANPNISLGSSDDERFRILINYKGTTTQEAQVITISSFTEGTGADDGRFQFKPDGSHVLDVDDGGIDFKTGFGISINGADIITDSSGTATLSNIDAIDATTVSTLNAALTAGDITGVTAGTNLSGGGTSGAVTINLANASTSVLGAASFSSDNFAASSGAITIKSGGVDLTDEVTGVLPSANMDGDTAHLTTTQTFTGAKTFTEKAVVFSDARTVAPGDGAFIHQDLAIITDGNTSASGTAAIFSAVSIEGARLAATNTSVTTTAAASLYIKDAPSASTNQTITNAYALWVDAGLVKFDGPLKVDGTITGNFTGDVTGDLTGDVTGDVTGDLTGDASGSSGSCTGQAATVATIAGLAPNTATTQATQPNIDSIGTDGDALSILGDVLSMANTTTNKPEIKLINNTDDATGPFINFWNQRSDSGVQDGEDNDVLGTILFNGYDDGTPSIQTYAGINAFIHDATSGEESGRLTFQVANHDGGLGSGLILTGGSSNNEIDVTLGLGAASVVTIPGGLSLGTDLPTDQQKHLAWFDIKGFSTGDGTNYEIPVVLDDNDAPWKHNVSTGSAGTTAIAVASVMRSAGLIAPRAGILKRWTGWTTTAGTSTANVALFKITPTRNDASDVAPVLLDNVAYTALGNNKMEDFDETSFTDADIAAGDIIITGIKAENNKSVYFSSTLEIEWDS